MELHRNQDIKPVNNLSSDHASPNKTIKSNVGQPQNFVNFDKKTSANMKGTPVPEHGIPIVPDYTKYKSESIEAEKNQTEKRVAFNEPMKIDVKAKEMPEFTKSVIRPMGQNPVDELFQNANVKEEKYEPKGETIKPPKKKRNFTKWIIIAIALELLIIGIVFALRNMGSKTILECISEEYNSYYEANMTTIKRFHFKKGKIVSLEDTMKYKFSDETKYKEFKELYAKPDKSIVAGRVFVFNLNDNDYTYEEKATYNYKKMRALNTSGDIHNIVIKTDIEDDVITLVDYNINDIKILYDDYTCR